MAERKQVDSDNEALRRKERLIVLGQLTATVSHEIRNPLGTIRNSVFTIGERIRGKGLGVEKALARIERNIIRCNDIIEGLLDYTSGRGLKLEQTDIDGWMESLLDDQMVPEGISLHNNLNSGVKIMLDRERSRRVVINIIQNAFDAVNGKREYADEKRLTIGTRSTDTRVEIYIRDNGTGIRSEEIEKIFEPLFSTKSFGIGLGLPIVRQIMRQHGGDIEIESAYGEGTTVRLWFPVRDV